MTRLPEQRRRHSISANERNSFLEALSSGWSITHAAELGGHGRQRFYELRQDDEGFAAAWAEALEAGTEILEDEARRRAVEGVDEPVYQGGELVGVVRRYSDRLLEFLLRGRRPTVYREGATVDVHLPGSHVHFEPDPARTKAVLEKLVDVGVLTHVPRRAELPRGETKEQPE